MSGGSDCPNHLSLRNNPQVLMFKPVSQFWLFQCIIVSFLSCSIIIWPKYLLRCSYSLNLSFYLAHKRPSIDKLKCHLSQITGDEKFQFSFTKITLWLLKLIMKFWRPALSYHEKTLNMNGRNKHRFVFKIWTVSSHLLAYGYVF